MVLVLFIKVGMPDFSLLQSLSQPIHVFFVLACVNISLTYQVVTVMQLFLDRPQVVLHLLEDLAILVPHSSYLSLLVLQLVDLSHRPFLQAVYFD